MLPDPPPSSSPTHHHHHHHSLVEPLPQQLVPPQQLHVLLLLLLLLKTPQVQVPTAAVPPARLQALLLAVHVLLPLCLLHLGLQDLVSLLPLQQPQPNVLLLWPAMRRLLLLPSLVPLLRAGQ